MGAWFSSFRVRLALVIGGLSLAMGLAATVYVDRVASREMTAASSDTLHNLSRAVAQALGGQLEARMREVTLLSQTHLLRKENLSNPDVRRQLELFKHSYSYYAWLGLADPDGVVLTAADGLLEKTDVSKRPWFIHGQNGAYFGDLHEAVLLAKKLEAPADGEPLRFVDFSIPVYDSSGHLRGVVASHVHWSWVRDVIRATLPPDAAEDRIETFVVNGAGQVLYPYESMGVVTVPDSLITDGVSILNNWDGHRYLAASAPLAADVAGKLDWRVVVRQPVAVALAPVTALQRTLIVLGGLASIFCMALAYQMAVGISKPVEQLAAIAQRIEYGDESTPFTVEGSTKEVRVLTASLKGMMATLLARRNFLEEVNEILEHRIQERTAELASLYNHAPVGYHTVGLDGLISHINDRELAMLGYSRAEVIGRMTVAQLLAPSCQANLREWTVLLRSGQSLPPVDAVMLRKDGSEVPVRLTSSAVMDEQGRFLMSHTAAMDVSKLKELEDSLRNEQALNLAIIQSSSNGLLLYAADGRCLLANGAAAHIVGGTMDALRQQNFHDIESWKTSGLYQKALEALGGQQGQELVGTTSSFGKTLDCQVTLVPVEHENERMLLVVVEDVSQLVASNRALDKLARHDALTGLKNRLAANECLHEAHLRLKRSAVAYTVLLMDIDFFKRVNDTYGHEVGDEVLKQVAGCLAETSRATDVVARFGGEEFLVVLADTEADGGRVVAEKIREAVADLAVPTVGQVTISIGISQARSDDAGADDAVRRADEALYRAKEQGRNRVAG